MVPSGTARTKESRPSAPVNRPNPPVWGAVIRIRSLPGLPLSGSQEM